MTASVFSSASAKFLSTLPARGATSGRQAGKHRPQHFYPRSPRGERPTALPSTTPPPSYFYPHSPRGERPDAVGSYDRWVIFLSTLPARGATCSRLLLPRPTDFYPRSPRGERPAQLRGVAGLADFYPRSPRGERPRKTGLLPSVQAFLSTLPARGATRQL